jgi:hypothetical protein
MKKIGVDGSLITGLIWLRRMQLIWKLIHISIQLIARRKKIYLTRGTIGRATISRGIVPTHYTIRTNGYDGPGFPHLKSWLVETSADGERSRAVAREEDNEQLNGTCFTGTFAVAGGGECRFIRLVNIGRNHRGDDRLCISAWEVFGNLIE